MFQKQLIVIDCSVAISWVIGDETNDKSLEILKRVLACEAVVPAIWLYEIGNTLLVAEKRKRITVDQRIRALNWFAAMHITISSHHNTRLEMHNIINLAHKYNLSVYDASYLHLALRKNLVLETFDKRLSEAYQLAVI